MYMGGGGRVFFANYSLILSYIFIKENLIFLYNCCQKWLDTLFKSLNTKNKISSWLTIGTKMWWLDFHLPSQPVAKTSSSRQYLRP